MPSVPGPSIPNGFTGLFSLPSIFGQQTSPEINVPADYWPAGSPEKIYPYLSSTQGQTDGAGNFVTFGSFVKPNAAAPGAYLGDPTKANANPPVSYVPKGATGETVFYTQVMAPDNWNYNSGKPDFIVVIPPVGTTPNKGSDY
jgi:hypothetical protein